MEENTVIRWIDELLENYECEPYGFLGLKASGDSIIFAFKFNEDCNDITIIVTKGYQEIGLDKADLYKDCWQDYIKESSKELN